MGGGVGGKAGKSCVQNSDGVFIHFHHILSGFTHWNPQLSLRYLINNNKIIKFIRWCERI